MITDLQKTGIIAPLLFLFSTGTSVGEGSLEQSTCCSENDQKQIDSEKKGKVFDNTAGLSFVWLPPTNIELGNKNYEAAFPDSPEIGKLEKPRSVQIDGFYIQSTETTNAQFKMYYSEKEHAKKENGPLKHFYDDNYKSFRSDDSPVIFVNVDDINSYCDWLKLRCGQSYRLPTEDEWEYACKCSVTNAKSKAIDLDKSGWFSENSDNHTHRVASKLPNSFGIFDMQGNVWEWTSTEFEKDLVAQTDWAGKKVLHIKGGGWANTQKTSTCTSRWAGWPPDYRSSTVGFRLVMENHEN